MAQSQRQPQMAAEGRQAALEPLQAVFPCAFFSEPAAMQPLMVDIHVPLCEWATAHGLSASAVRRALATYCDAPAYQQRVIAGGWRVNLQGEPVAEVTEEGQAHARLRLERISAARTADQAAQVEAARLRHLKKQAEQAARKAAHQPAQKATPPVKLKGKVSGAVDPVAPAPTPAPTLPTVIVKKRRTVVMPS